MDVYAIDISNQTVNPLARLGTIGSLLNIFIPMLTTGAAVLLLMMLLYGSFTWITAGGKADNVVKAQKIMTFAVLGLILVILSFIAVKLITSVFNISAPI